MFFRAIFAIVLCAQMLVLLPNEAFAQSFSAWSHPHSRFVQGNQNQWLRGLSTLAISLSGVHEPYENFEKSIEKRLQDAGLTVISSDRAQKEKLPILELSASVTYGQSGSSAEVSIALNEFVTKKLDAGDSLDGRAVTWRTGQGEWFSGFADSSPSKANEVACHLLEESLSQFLANYLSVNRSNVAVKKASPDFLQNWPEKRSDIVSFRPSEDFDGVITDIKHVENAGGEPFPVIIVTANGTSSEAESHGPKGDKKDEKFVVHLNTSICKRKNDEVHTEKQPLLFSDLKVGDEIVVFSSEELLLGDGKKVPIALSIRVVPK
jgi:hypothetical protein